MIKTSDLQKPLYFSLPHSSVEHTKDNWPGSSPGSFSVMSVSKVLETGLLLFRRRFEAALWAEEGR